MARSPQESGKQNGRIRMIFDQKDPKRTGRDWATRKATRYFGQSFIPQVGGNGPEANDKFCAMILALAQGNDRSAMEFDNRTTDRKAETKPTKHTRARAFALFKGVEDPRHVFRVNSNAAVRDFD